ncbi:MAG: ADP-ribose pyrophosphatase [Deltaproteobacteria bacterium HGW-Deltaproteobacteria-15]|jgi:ADP-ribose pyrophosphatase|nr:MAG: ADP-ribose pyrophosphatase [Deltaproteobacteria bacterium HGW-Deltaproteobacteria-15]
MEKKIQTIATLRTHSFLVNLDEVLLRDGSSAKRVRIDHPEAAAVVPFLSDREILLVRQYRYALGRETLEIPAGKLDPSEKPEECAGRELLEETGYEAGSLTLLYAYAPAIGYSNELIHIYAGRNLRKLQNEIDQREISSVESFTIEEISSMIREGRIIDGKTLIGLAVLGLLPSTA